jgi:hypothetical protein
VTPVILEVTAPKDSRFTPDDDWLRLPENQCEVFAWERSLVEFGQVGIIGTVSPKQVIIHPLTFRQENRNFSCGESYLNQKFLTIT